MKKTMITLLASAVALLELGENAVLSEKIDAFKALGDGVTETDVEAVALKETVDTIKAEEKTKADEAKAEAKRLADEAKANQASAEPKHFMGIKMIGNLFYSKEDNYKTGFATAKECALEHNK